MSNQQRRTLQQTRTSLAAADVLAAAKTYFSRRQGIYAAFPEKEGPTFVSLRGQGGEEIIIGVTPDDAGTLVSGSTYLFDQQIARFFTTLPPFPTEDGGSGATEAGGMVEDDASSSAGSAA